ncbi:unnamed protein product [Schistosoma margrebowiei]|uniref:Uncharacterized protein n=1 Tax=Schistosoma margrebowiei TaxID=48269 RepID=A0A183MCY5_9TREM|nr:unnamed protein product [Schistosoma margrebowiei]
MQFDGLGSVCPIHFHRLFLISSSAGSWNATLALPILAFTSASEPPCSSMMLPSASAGILSGPAAFPLSICLMAILISSVVGGLTSIEDLCVLLRCPVDSLEPAYSGVPRSTLPICSAVIEFQ